MISPVVPLFVLFDNCVNGQQCVYSGPLDLNILGPEESDHSGDEHGLEGIVRHGQAHQGGRVWGQEGG